MNEHPSIVDTSLRASGKLDAFRRSRCLAYPTDAIFGKREGRWQRLNVQLTDFPGLLREAYRVLRSEGLLLVHEPQCALYSAWEGFEASDLAPNLTRVSGRTRVA